MPRKKVLFIVFAIILVDMLGVGILIPIIPLLFTDPSYAYHLAIDEDTGYLLLGGLTALYPFMMFLAMPVLGQLSDTYGRKPLLAFSLFGTAIGYALFAIGIILQNIPLLFISRALDGLTGGNVVVAQAAIADSTTEEDRVRSFGIIGAANGIGFVLGPIIGAVLSEPRILNIFGAPTPFWFAAGLSVINMLAVIYFFSETNKKRTKKKINLWQGFNNIRQAATGHDRRTFYVTAFLYQSGFAFIITFFGVYLISRFGFGQIEIAYLFAFVGVLLAITQIVVIGPLSRFASPQVIVPSALAIMGVALFLVYFAYDVLLLCLLTIPVAICAGLALTNLTALISTSSKDREQGSALGINSSVQSLAQTIPPLFAGAIAAIFAPTTPVIFAATIIFAAAVFFVISTKYFTNAT